MGKVSRKGGEITLVLSVDEAEWVAACLLEAGFPLDPETRTTFALLNAALQPPKVVAPHAHKCEAKGCYKFGHTFSERGWFGEPGKNNGHIDVSPFHTR